MTRRRWIGRWIVGVGVVHTAFGLIFQRGTLAVLWGEGLVNTVNGQPEREFAFWFIFFGLLAILFGLLVDWCEKRQLGLPRFLGWALLVLTSVCVVIMPISGGWLLLPPAVGAMRESRAGTS